MLGFLSIIRQNIILKTKARILGLLNPLNLINIETEEEPKRKRKIVIFIYTIPKTSFIIIMLWFFPKKK